MQLLVFFYFGWCILYLFTRLTMDSSKRSKSRSPEASNCRSKSRHRSKKSRSNDIREHEVNSGSTNNNTRPPVLNELLTKITQLSSCMENMDNRLGVLESNQNNQADISNAQMALIHDDSACCHSSEREDSGTLINCL